MDKVGSVQFANFCVSFFLEMKTLSTKENRGVSVMLPISDRIARMILRVVLFRYAFISDYFSGRCRWHGFSIRVQRLRFLHHDDDDEESDLFLSKGG